MSGQQIDVAVGTSVNAEVLWTGVPAYTPGDKTPAEYSMGVTGTSCNVAHVLKSCGHHPLLIGAVGSDMWPAVITAYLDGRGIAHHLLVAREQTCFASMEPESGRHLSAKPPIIQDKTGEVVEILRSHHPKFQVITGLMPDEGEIALAKATLTQNGGTRILNPRQTLVAKRPLFLDLITQVDWLFMNRYEAAEYLGCNSEGLTTESLQSFLDLGVKMVVVTRDGDGVLAVNDKGSKIDIPAHNAGRHVDEKGAGDCFLGFYLASLLKGYYHEQAIALATVAAGIKVTKIGAANIPAFDEVISFMS